MLLQCRSNALVEESSRRGVWWFARDPLAKGAAQGTAGDRIGTQWTMNRETTGLQESRIKDVDETTKIVLWLAYFDVMESLLHD